MQRARVKQANDYQVAGQVQTIELMWGGEHAGRILSVWPTSQYMQCVTTVFMYNKGGPLYDYDETIATGRAGGGGYCRRSASMYEALLELPKGKVLLGGKDLGGAGVTQVCKALRFLGYTLIGDTS